MVRSDPIGTVGETGGNSGWALLVERDGATALVDAVLELDPEESYTKTELSDAADVAYKTLYLGETVEALVDVGLLEADGGDGEEATFAVNAESAVYEAAAAFDEAVARRQRFESA